MIFWNNGNGLTMIARRFSATWPREVRSLAHSFLNDFLHVTIGADETTANAAVNLHG